MKRKLLGKTGKYCFWGMVISGFMYAIAALMAVPAYADSCTPTECNAIKASGSVVCQIAGLGTFDAIECPQVGSPDFALVRCSHGTTEVECGND